MTGLGSVTLCQLAFRRLSELNFPWDTPDGDNKLYELILLLLVNIVVVVVGGSVANAATVAITNTVTAAVVVVAAAAAVTPSPLPHSTITTAVAIVVSHCRNRRGPESDKQRGQ